MQQSDLQTQKSIYQQVKQQNKPISKQQITQVPQSDQALPHAQQNFYIEKLSAHLQFMQKQFAKNIQQQKNIIQQIKKRHSHPDAHQTHKIFLCLSQTEEKFIKNLLVKQLVCVPTTCNLKGLLDLAMDTEKQNLKNQIQSKFKIKTNSKYPPIVGSQVPKIISIRNLLFQRQVKENRSKMIDLSEPKEEIIPKFQSVMQTPSSNHNMMVTFSPNKQVAEDVKYQSKVCLKNSIYMLHQSSQLPQRLQLLPASITKRLSWQEEDNYLGSENVGFCDDLVKQNDKVSLNYSLSNDQKQEYPKIDKIFQQDNLRYNLFSGDFQKSKNQTKAKNHILDRNFCSPQNQNRKCKGIQQWDQQFNIFSQHRKYYPNNHSQINIPKMPRKQQNDVFNLEQLSSQKKSCGNYKKEKPVACIIRRSGQ